MIQTVDHRSRLNRALRGVEVLFDWETIESLLAFKHVRLLRNFEFSVILIHKLEFLVLTRLVDVNNMLLSLLHNDLPNVFHVSLFRAIFDFNSDLWVLNENFIVQELFGN